MQKSLLAANNSIKEKHYQLPYKFIRLHFIDISTPIDPNIKMLKFMKDMKLLSKQAIMSKPWRWTWPGDTMKCTYNLKIWSFMS